MAAEKSALAASIWSGQRIKEDSSRKINALNADIEAERQTYKSSQGGLNDIYRALEKQLLTERQAREAAEADVARAMLSKPEFDAKMAMRDEQAAADVLEKCNTIFDLRKQLEDLKSLGLAAQNSRKMVDAKLQARETELLRFEVFIVALCGSQLPL